MKKLHKSALYATTALSVGLALPIAAPAADTQGGNGVEEVVVTARRIEERLQDVPISITVYNQRQLTDANISSPADLAVLTPSLSVNNQFGFENSSFALRGFEQDIGTAPTVGVFFADVVAPRGGMSDVNTHGGDGAGPGAFFDLQNVQVLKGPQGTLFGRNTTGGEILLVPQKPTQKYEGYFEASGGNYGMEELQGVVNLPINEKVRLRVGFDQKKRDGYMNNVSGVGPKDFNDINYIAGRVSLVVDVADDIENYTIASFSQSDTNGPIEKNLHVNAAQFPFLGGLTAAQVALEPGPYDASNGLADAKSYLRTWQIINTTNWTVSDDLTVKNVASYSQLQSVSSSVLFGDDWKLPGFFGPLAGQHLYFVDVDSAPGGLGSDQQSFTEELQAHGAALGGKLDWQAGAYMEGSHPLGIAGADGVTFLDCFGDPRNNQCIDPLGAGNTHTSFGTITYRNYGLYGQGTYAILDDLKFTGGVRWTDDSTTGQVELKQNTFRTPFVPVPSCQLPSFIGTVATNCLLSLHVSSRAPTWTMDLDWTPNEDLLTYVKYSRGYRQGGIYPTGPIDAAIGTKYLTFQPEQVDTYEIGAKQSFHGEISGSLDVAAFYNDFSNQQIENLFNSTVATPTAAVVNAGSSRIYGLEIGSTIQPVKDVTLRLDYAYINSKINAIDNPPLPANSLYTSEPQGAPGVVLPYTPHHKLTFTATYRLPVDESIGKITVGATYSYTGAQAVNPLVPYGYLPSYDLLNFNVNWESIGGSPFDAEFFMTNALNTYYSTTVWAYYSVYGFGPALIGEPRMFGGRVRVHF